MSYHAAQSDGDAVLFDARSDAIAVITLNRPQRRNCLDKEVRAGLFAAWERFERDPALRVAVLTGAGKAFCAGQDLKEHVGLLQEGDPAPLRTVADHYNPIVKAITGMPKPVIAAVNGPAAGAGAALAYASDLRIAAGSANFLMAFANVGLGPDSGASWTLQRLVGYGRAQELMMLARTVDSTEALRIGLVGEVVADDELAGRAQELALKLAAGPTVAYAKIKSTLATAAEGTLDDALAAEEQAQAELGGTADHTEAVDAFVNKRKAIFTGK